MSVFCARAAFAQHSLQTDDGAGHYSLITGSNPGGTYTLPSGGGLLLTSSSLTSYGWSLTGNGSTNPATNFLGTTDNQPLVVKTNNIERLRVLTNGTLGFGTTTPNSTYGTAKFEMASEGYLAPTDMLIRNAVDNFGYAPGYIIEHARGTLAAPTAVLAGDYLGAFWVLSYDGTNHVPSAGIDVWSDAAVATGKVPAKIVFSTADASTGVNTPRMTIRSSGFVGIGEANPGALLSVGSGNLLQVNSSGDLAKIKNVSYSWPASNALGSLTNDGSGNLSWSAASGWLTTGNNVSGSDFANNLIGSTAGSTLTPVRIIVNGTVTMSFTNIGGLGPNVIGGLSNNTVNIGTGPSTATGINVIGGGGNNTLNGGEASVIGGGFSNTVSSNAGSDGDVNTIAGGLFNQIISNYGFSGVGLNTIGGGRSNRANGAAVANSGYNTVAGGQSNDASGAATSGSGWNFIGGGNGNTASGGGSVIGGGFGNYSIGSYSSVGGGFDNVAGSATAIADVVAGGYINSATGGSSTVGGGTYNTAAGLFSTIPGGAGLTLNGAGSFGFLANPVATTYFMTVNASMTSVFGNTDIWIASNDNTAHALFFYAPYNANGAFPNGTKYVALKAGAVSTSVTYTLPTADGSNGDVLTTNGSGVMSWTTPSAPAVTYGGNSGGNTANNSFLSPFGSGASAVEAQQQIVVTRNGILKHLYANLTAAPGVGNSKTFTVRVNGVSTAISVTLTGAVTSGSDVANTVAVVAGDLVTILVTHTGAPTASVGAFGLELY